MNDFLKSHAHDDQSWACVALPERAHHVSNTTQWVDVQLYILDFPTMNLRGHEKWRAHEAGMLHIHNQAAAPQVRNLQRASSVTLTWNTDTNVLMIMERNDLRLGISEMILKMKQIVLQSDAVQSLEGYCFSLALTPHRHWPFLLDKNNQAT